MSALKDLAQDDIKIIIQEAEEMAEKLKSVKTHQLRNVFSAISKMRMDYKHSKMKHSKALAQQAKGAATERSEAEFEKAVGDRIYEDLEITLLFMKPKIAYAAGRIKDVRPFYDFMKSAIEAVENSSNKGKALKHFFMLMESIVAYHKFNDNN